MGPRVLVDDSSQRGNRVGVKRRSSPLGHKAALQAHKTEPGPPPEAQMHDEGGRALRLPSSLTLRVAPSEACFVEGGEVGIENHFLTTHDKNSIGDEFCRYY